ncbi:MAG: YcxB family protein [Acetivibrionales bacterium]
MDNVKIDVECNSKDFGSYYPSGVAYGGKDITEEKRKNGCIYVLDFELSIKEYLKFFFRNYFSNPAIIIVTILGVLALYRYFQLLEHNIMFYLMFGLTFTFVIPVFIVANVKNILKKVNPFHYEFYENHILTTNSSCTTSTNWGDFTKIKETKTEIRLINKSNIIVIPKRIFESNPENLRGLKKIIEQFIKK